MAPKRESTIKREDVVKIGSKGPTPPFQPTIPTTSKEPPSNQNEVPLSRRKKICRFIYNRETKKILGRTAWSWFYIVTYSLIYLMFLITYTLLFLFAILMAYKYYRDYEHIDKTALLTYSDRGVGLSATPTSEYSYPMIWYKMGNENDYQKYVSAIDRLLVSRRNANFDYSDLGPCSKPPYGYGSVSTPCIILRINRQLKWAGKPLRKNSTTTVNAPKEVKEWMSSSEKLWLHCDGYHTYDKEHIGKISYYPNPPGFDPNLFPLDVRNQSPLVAIQVSGFAQGVSLAIQCNLWYEDGPASIEFMLYVEPQMSVKNSTNKNYDKTITN